MNLALQGSRPSTDVRSKRRSWQNGNRDLQPDIFFDGPGIDRADALRAVTAAADYFERYEPHAPMGATLREVDRRARMSLADLLEELIPDSETRETFYWRSGIRPPQPPVEAEEY